MWFIRARSVRKLALQVSDGEETNENSHGRTHDDRMLPRKHKIRTMRGRHGGAPHGTQAGPDLR